MRKVYKTQIQRQCPDCRVDIIGRHGVVITSLDGRRKYVSVRHRIADKDPLTVRLVYWLVPAVIWMSAMLMLFSVVLMAAYGML